MGIDSKDDLLTGRQWQNLGGPRGDARVSRVAERFKARVVGCGNGSVGSSGESKAVRDAVTGLHIGGMGEVWGAGEGRCSSIGCGDNCGSCGVDPLDGMGDGSYAVGREAEIAIVETDASGHPSAAAEVAGAVSADLKSAAAVGADVAAGSVTTAVNSGASQASENGSGTAPRLRRRVIVSGGTVREVGASRQGVSVSASAGNAENAGILPGFPVKSGRKQPVSVLSAKGGDLLHNAVEKGERVVIIRTSGSSLQVLRGVPVKYGSNQSGFRLYVSSYGRFCNDDRVHNMGGRYVDIFTSDFVILDSDCSAGDVADYAVAYAVRGKTRSSVGQVCGQNSDHGSGEAVSDVTARKRNYDTGHFLDRVDRLDSAGARVRVEKMLSPKVRDIINILKEREPCLARFLMSVLGFGQVREQLIQRTVAELAEEKSFEPDFETAIEFSNWVLDKYVPSVETKRSGTTFSDHGAGIQVEKIGEGDDRCRAFLPDLEEGESDFRTELFAWHSRVRDGFLPQINVDTHKLLVDALLFQYCGVPVRDLGILFSKGSVVKTIVDANKALADLGLRVVLNNGFAVLGEVDKPVMLLADEEDAKQYKDRFSWYVGGSVDDARKLYSDGVEKKASRRCSVQNERARRGTVNTAIREFVKGSNEVRMSDDRVRALVDAFVFDRKNGGAEGAAESVEATVADVGESVADVAAESKPEWIEVVDEVTPELRSLHELAVDVGLSGVGRPGSRHACYVHGQFLVLALIGQYHGVSRTSVERLPFNFKKNRDTGLDSVIGKVNDGIREDGLKVYERGGVLILGHDIEAGCDASSKVQVLGKRLSISHGGYPQHYIKKLLRSRDGKKVGSDDDFSDEAAEE